MMLVQRFRVRGCGNTSLGHEKYVTADREMYISQSNNTVESISEIHFTPDNS